MGASTPANRSAESSLVDEEDIVYETDRVVRDRTNDYTVNLPALACEILGIEPGQDLTCRVTRQGLVFEPADGGDDDV